MAFVRAGLLTLVSFEETTEPLNHQQCFLLRAKCSKLASEEMRKGQMQYYRQTHVSWEVLELDVGFQMIHLASALGRL